MKKWLCLLACAQLVAVTAKAGVLLYEDFSYSNGSIVANSSTVWTNHSGTSADALVVDGRYEIDQARRDDVSRAFTTPNADQYLYASFTLRMTQVPSAGGAYFAHFKDEGNNFLARVFAASTNTAVPGTFRLGVLNSSSGNATFLPIDLATNVDYQVVVSYDTVSFISTLQVSPASSTDLSAMNSSPVTGTAATAVMGYYAFRQSSGEGVMTVDNLLVGNSFGEVATNVVTAPTVGLQPIGGTIFAGENFTLYSVGAGSGAAQLTYQWRRNGANLSEGGAYSGVNSNVLRIANATVAQGGNYDVVVTGPGGNVTSQVAALTINVAPSAPQIVLQPVSTTNSMGSTVNFTVDASGTTPLSYQWTFFGTNLPGATSNVLTLTAVTPANSGPYRAVVSNSVGTKESDIAYLFVPPPVRTNIAYLRTLLDPVNYLPTDTNTLFEVQGVVVTHTNMTTAANAQYYISDGTAGIVLFNRNGGTFRPNAGDLVRVVGPLEHFNSLLELAPNANNAMHVVEIVSSNAPMPNSRSFHFSQTNDLQFMEQQLEGSLVTVTNVYFAAANGSATFAANGNYVISNALGQTATLRIDSRVTTLNGIVIPPFAYEVTGALGQFLNATATPRNSGYQLMISRPEDIVMTLPAAPSLKITRSSGSVRLEWPTQQGSTYTVHASSDLQNGFAPVAFGINSLLGDGSYTEATTNAAVRLFRVTSP